MPLYQITGPDGKIYEIEGPEGATREEVISAIQYRIRETEKPPEKQSGLRQLADVPLKTSAGVVSGVRFLADAFGADNPVSKNLREMEDYIAELYSAQSKADSQKISEIMKEAEDKGFGAQLGAAVQAFATAPVDFLANALGTAAPTIATGMLGTVAKVGALGVRGMQAATGAGMGAGVVKSSIYDAVKQELTNSGIPAEEVERRAVAAQSYAGDNLDMITTGTGIGAITGITGLEPQIIRGILGGAAKEAAQATTQLAPKGMARRAGETAVVETIPETVQGAQEQLAQNIALQREGFDVPTGRGVAGAGALEGLAGAGLGAAVGAISQDPAVIQRANQEAETNRKLAEINAERARQQLIVDEAKAGLPVMEERQADLAGFAEANKAYTDAVVKAKETYAAARSVIPEGFATEQIKKMDTVEGTQDLLQNFDNYFDLSPADAKQVKAGLQKNLTALRRKEAESKKITPEEKDLATTFDAYSKLGVSSQQELEAMPLDELQNAMDVLQGEIPGAKKSQQPLLNRLEDILKDAIKKATPPEVTGTLEVPPYEPGPPAVTTLTSFEQLGQPEPEPVVIPPNAFPAPQPELTIEERMAQLERAQQEQEAADFELQEQYPEPVAPSSQEVMKGEANEPTPSVQGRLFTATGKPTAAAGRQPVSGTEVTPEVSDTDGQGSVDSVVLPRESTEAAAQEAEGPRAGGLGIVDRPSEGSAVRRGRGAEEQPATLEQDLLLAEYDAAVEARQKAEKKYEALANRLSEKSPQVRSAKAQLDQAIEVEGQVSEKLAGAAKEPQVTTTRERATAKKILDGANQIAAMGEEVRDNTQIGDFPGSASAYHLYEARKLLPKPSDKLKKVTESNTFDLHTETEFVANVDGNHYYVNKEEDPDNEEGFVYTFSPATDPFRYVQTTHFDVAELIGDIRKDIAEPTTREEANKRAERDIAEAKAREAEGYDPDEFLYSKPGKSKRKKDGSYKQVPSLKTLKADKPSSVEAVEKAAERLFNPVWLKQAQNQGWLHILPGKPSDVAELADANIPNAQGVYMGRKGHVYIFPENIPAGGERGVLLHEIGEHKGLEAMIGAENVTRLANRVRTMAKGSDQSAEIAKRALERAEESGTGDDKEIVAYFTEVAVNEAGIEPGSKTKPGLGKALQWVNELWNSISAAMRKLALNVNTINSQDMVDIVYGAARLQMGATDTSSESATGETRTSINTQLESEMDTQLAAAGGKLKDAISSSPFQALRDAPKTYVTEKYKGVGDFLDNVETRWFSSDAKLSKAIRRGMEQAGVKWEDMRKTLYAITTSQTLHGENVAHQVLETGNIAYDPETMKYYAVADPAGSWKMAVDTINAAANKYGITPAKMQAYAHQAFVAQRLEALESKNEALRSRITELEAAGKDARAKQLRDKIVIVHLDAAQRQTALKFLKQFPELNTAFTQWNNTRQNILNFAVDAGLYTKENAEILLDNMDYVPFFRVEQIDNQAGPKEYSRGLLDAAKDKRLVGSMDDVNNVFDNMERWISYTIRKGINNRAAQNLANYAVEYLPDEVRTVDKVAKNKRANTIGIWENGKRQLYEFDDPLYIDAFTGIESVALPGLKALTTMSNILRQNIVLNPLFSLGQLPQDAFGAMFSSGVKNPFAIPLNVMSEFVKTIAGTSKAHQELTRYGAAGQRDYSAAMSRVDAETAEGLRNPSTFEKVLSPLRRIATASDNAVRQAIYNQTMKETGDKALAVERAFEVINFRRSGSNPYVGIARQVVPFFGAYLQAMNVVYKTLTARGIAPTERAEALRVWTSTIPKVMVLSLLYSMLMGDDEDYLDDDPVTRARKLYVPGVDGLTIPLRPDLFTFISKIVPEQIYRNMTDEMTMDGTKTRTALRDALVDAVAGPTAVPQAIKPLIEVALNRNFFTGRDLVGQGLQYLDKPEQYSFNTSEFAKTLGKSGVISPIVADHLLRNYFGYTGGIVLMGLDATINAGSDIQKPTMPTRDFIASIPGMSPFVTRELGVKNKNDFYELREKVNTAVNTFNRVRETDPARAKDYRDENKELLRVQTQVNRINQMLADLRKRERIIRESPRSRMSPEQKEEAILKLKLQEQRILKNVAQLRNTAGL